MLSFFDNRPVIETGILIRTDKFRQVVNRYRFLIFTVRQIVFEHNTGRFNRDDLTVSCGNHCDSGIFCNDLFDAGSHKRRLTLDQRYCLPLHV